MRLTRRLRRSVLVATLLIAAGTLALASVPPRPLRSVATLVHALSLHAATDWVAVVALLAVGERFVSADRVVTRRAVRRLGLAVFAAAFAIEASPLARLVVEPAAVPASALAEGLSTAVRRALFPAGLFVATVAGAATLRRDLVVSDGLSGLPLAPDDDRLLDVAPDALVRVGRVLGAAAALSVGVEVLTRLALGEPYAWLVVAEATVGALGAFVDHAVVAAAFLALVARGVRARSLVGGAVAVWLSLFALGIVLALLSAGLGVALVGATATPMAAVENAGMGLWPRPDSWALLLSTATFAAGAMGLLAIQRAAPADIAESTSATSDSSGLR